jgi:hypothetical protein
MTMKARVLFFLAFAMSTPAVADSGDCDKPRAAENLQQARAFLAENRNEVGVVTTAPPDIGPNELLVFEMELLHIVR